MHMEIARNSVFDCHLSPVGRQMTIEKSGDKWQSKNLFRMIFDLRSSIVLTFSIAGYPVRNFQKYLKEIQLIFIASYTATCDFQQCGILT